MIRGDGVLANNRGSRLKLTKYGPWLRFRVFLFVFLATGYLTDDISPY